MEGHVSIIMQGGWVMIPIALSSVVGLAVFLERLFFFHSVGKNAAIIKKEMELFHGLKLGEAASICSKYPGAASNIIKAGLMAASSRHRDEIERAMEDAARFELPRLNKGLPILATVVNIATLLGLLGTVLGMISSTSVLASQGLGNPADLIRGISEALVTTAAGLIIAIPGQIAYNYLVAKSDTLIIEIEATATNLIRVLKSAPSSILPSPSLGSASSAASSPSIKRW